MVFHHEYAHGRAFHGLEARNLLEKEKRDSHGDKIMMHVPHEHDNKMRFIHNHPGKFAAQQQNDVPVETIYSQIYVTESKTFPGPGQLVTEIPTPATPLPVQSTAPAANAAAAAAASVSIAAAESYAQAKSLAQNPHTFSSSASYNTKPVQRTRSAVKTSPLQFTRISTPTSSSVALGGGRVGGSPIHTTRTPTPVSSSVALGGGRVRGSPIHTTRAHSAVAGSPLAATRTSNAQLIDEKTNSSGMSSAGKAGVAFAVLIAVALAAGIAYWCIRRRKNKRDNDGHEQIFDEKHGSKNSFFGGTAAAVGAPAGSSRGSVQSEKVASSLRSTRTASTAPRLSLRPVTQFLTGFGTAEGTKSSGNALDIPPMSEKPKSGWERRVEQNPFDDSRSVSPPANPFEEGDGAAMNVKSTPNHSAKSFWESNDPGTPKSAKSGTGSAVAITAAGGVPTPRGPNNVHRVQLDFKPSMEDELELISGQLVRMLHEYDDGWALCIRMDRSQQGVCPRTCLSKLPVKPRPQGPPQHGPGGRPTGPPPNMRRPQSPQVPNGMMPRPLTPTSRERSATLGRNSPARKPAPGQAL